MARCRSTMALAGGALALLAVAALAAPAAAKPRSYSVRIDSKPDGATVYLDSKDSEPLGRTPYSGKLPEGRYTLIIELDGFVASIQEIRVARKRGVQRFSAELKQLEEGSIEVVPAKAQAQLEGARIFIDGADEGNLPDIISVEAGPHQVEVKKEGYRTFESWVEVAPGETTKVIAELVPLEGTRVAAAASDGGDAGDDAEDEQEEVEVEVEAEKAATPAARRAVPIVALAGGVEVGARKFRYQNPTMGNLRPYDAGGVPIIRVSADVAPLAFLDSRLASGLTLSASYARATPLDSSARINEGEVNEMVARVPTTWTELDLALGFRFHFGRGSYVGARGGFGVHTFTFTYKPEFDELRGTIPDVKYEFVSVGLDSRFALGERFALLLAGGPRLVRKTGDIGTRFASTDVVAFGAAGGLAFEVTRSLEARLVGRFDQYGHTFTLQDSPMIAADGGTDRMFGGTLSAVYRY